MRDNRIALFCELEEFLKDIQINLEEGSDLSTTAFQVISELDHTQKKLSTEKTGMNLTREEMLIFAQLLGKTKNQFEKSKFGRM